MIKPGMTIAEAIMQLTRGFRKMMQRDPDGLEKIKIKQEAVQKLKDLEKVVDMEGNVIDTSKGIMGGKQMKAMGGRIGYAEGTPSFEEYMQERQGIERKQMLEQMYKEYLEDLRRKKVADQKQMVADGGRIGLKDGPDKPSRRNFMRIMGGLAAIPVFGKFFRQADKVAPAAEKVMENFSSTASQAPQYFLDLVTKIKAFGKQSKVGPSERVNEFSYTGKNGDEYTLTEDIVTGDAQITKDKIGVGTYGDKSFDTINDRTVMDYKAPKQDVDVETGRGIRENAEYEEYRVEFDQDGTEAGADAINEMIQKEIIEEAKKSAPSIKKTAIKKAGGGLAYMLGE